MKENNTFNKISLIKLRKMNIDEVSKYYMELRKFEFDEKEPAKGIEIRKKIHGLLVQIIKIDRILNHEKLEVISDKRKKTDRPIVYACTHIGGNDVQRVFEALKTYAHLFLGDPKELYVDFSGLLLKLNGVINVETNNKEDRNIGFKSSVKVLAAGGRVIVYSEGCWNTSENLLVLGTYEGTVKMAKLTGADIVPVGIEQYGNQFYVSIGENITREEYSKLSIKETNTLLRDRMATEKWNTIERNGIEKRSSISDEYKKNFAQSIIDRCDYDFSLEEVLSAVYKDKNITTEEEAFKFLNKIEINKNNAFLMKDKLKYEKKYIKH